MTLDEAIQAATSLLDQRGQLLNGHLLRLVEGDKELFRVVRERLITKGIAEDRSGVGLARTDIVTSFQRGENSPGVTIDQRSTETIASGERSAEINVANVPSPPTDWWLMKAGKVLGPMDLEQVCKLCRSGEIESADVVRHSDRGLWKPLDSVPEIAVARRPQGSQSASRSGLGEFNRPEESAGDREESVPKEQFVFPEKGWSIDHKPQRSLLGHAWNFASGCVGGSERLSIILFVTVCAAGFYYWWHLPPSNAVIIEEFTACRRSMQKLRERRVPRSEWSPMEERYRSRIEAIVNRLKPYANDRHPVEQSLYLAGKIGLLPMMEYAADPTPSEQAFEKQMAIAKQTK